MELTREQAIANHRKMWKWIEEESLKRGKGVIKNDYFEAHPELEIPKRFCYCCEYDTQCDGVCDSCPIDWGEDLLCYNDGSPYRDWSETSIEDPITCAFYASRIANLPEKVIEEEEIKMKNNELKEWAKREIELMSMEEDSTVREKMETYCTIALQEFLDFLEKIEHLDKPEIAKTIFMQLLNENPLSPIEDNEEDWVCMGKHDDPGYAVYKSKRWPTLFKRVNYDCKTGEITNTTFSDTGRYECIDINTSEVYSGGIGPVILDEAFPIRMPYYPTDRIKIFTERFKYHEDLSPVLDPNHDTYAVLYFRLGGEIKEVKRFFKEEPKTHELVEIDKTEYFSRRKRVYEKK